MQDYTFIHLTFQISAARLLCDGMDNLSNYSHSNFLSNCTCRFLFRFRFISSGLSISSCRLPYLCVVVVPQLITSSQFTQLIPPSVHPRTSRISFIQLLASSNLWIGPFHFSPPSPPCPSSCHSFPCPVDFHSPKFRTSHRPPFGSGFAARTFGAALPFFLIHSTSIPPLGFFHYELFSSSLYFFRILQHDLIRSLMILAAAVY